MIMECSPHTSVCNFQLFCTLRLSYFYCVDDECRSFQHVIYAFCRNCNFVPETTRAAKTVQLKHERKADPLIGYLKRFYPVHNTHICVIFYFIQQSSFSRVPTKYVERERKKGLMVRAREIGFFLPAVSNCIFVKKEKKNHLLC